jgi:ActR/RegA family two-component response regulator
MKTELLMEKAYALFAKQINLLIVDDSPHIRDSLVNAFISPLFNIAAADTLAAAEKTIATRTKWHCWLLDIDLARGQSGLTILKSHKDFPFSMVLSGLRSMNLAADAMKLGALGVFDKDPEKLEEVYHEVCKISALGYVLGGKPTQHFDAFILLANDCSIATVEAWAEKANVTQRHLQRICSLNTTAVPLYTIWLMRAIYYLLWNVPSSYEKELKNPRCGPDPQQEDFYLSCIENLVK